MKFELPKLPYQANELEPVISKQTIDLHYGKHLQTYVNNLNSLIVGTAFEHADIETIVRQSEGGIFNNAGQILNHTLYFLQFSHQGGDAPKGALADAINTKFGSFGEFKKVFTEAAVTLFGSGWAWLAKDENGELQILKESNAGNPLTKGMKPILAFDVWEHAYYVDYQNRRAEHIEKIWNIIDWNVVEKRF
ncbi:MAG: superoxide dismutase [Prevotellaceae bacterium]|jgi:Fe-Mn family superoxide dismutase|nr:superoxide dismutase [Prevotellaceae bacterium]